MGQQAARKLRRALGGSNMVAPNLYTPTGATIGEALQNQQEERREWLAAELLKIGAENSHHGDWPDMAESAVSAALTIYPDIEGAGAME